MSHRTRPLILLTLLTLLVLLSSAAADTLILKDGKRLEGSVMKAGERYWIQTPDGKSQYIPAADVKDVLMSATASTGGSSPSTTPAKRSLTFTAAKAKADIAETPIAALAVWQSFLDANPPPDPAEAAQAKDELKKWQKLADEDAEKINGKWVGGPERKAIVDKAGTLIKDGITLLEQSKTLQAIKKFEEAVKVYPNSYDATSFLGYMNLLAGKNDEAIKYFTACLKLRPSAPDALNNLGICMIALTKTNPRNTQLWDRAFEKFKAAAESEDDPMIAHNINKALAVCPPEAKKTAVARQAEEAGKLLAAKYHLPADLATRQFMIMPPRSPRGSDADIRPGMISSGTGFIIQDDGLILTNRHVVNGAEHLLVMLDGKKQLAATVVAIDKEFDLALIKIKSPKALPTIALAKTDAPNEGAQCYAIGFPLLDRLGTSLKVTQGIVSGSNRTEGGADVLTDAKVNPGNSGGPLVDKAGQVMGIVTMKSRTTSSEDSYGMAISTGKIRKFLKTNKIDLTPAANDKPLTPEEIVTKVKPATVCIISTQ